MDDATLARLLAPTLGKEGASMFFREGISRLSTAKPEEIAALKTRFPDFFAEGVPVEDAVVRTRLPVRVVTPVTLRVEISERAPVEENVDVAVPPK